MRAACQFSACTSGETPCLAHGGDVIQYRVTDTIEDGAAADKRRASALRALYHDVQPDAAVDKIQARIADLIAQRGRLIPHHQDCVNEQDWHGAWDGAVYIANIECEITGLKFALKALGVEP